MAAARAARPLVLCFHGLYQDALQFRSKAASLTRCFVDFDLRFLDGPHTATPAVLRDSAGRRTSRAPADPDAFRAWWPKDPSDPAGPIEVERTVQAVQSALGESEPVVGVMGFSQGGALAALTCTRAFRARTGWTPRFAVVLSAYVPDQREAAAYMESGFEPAVRSLHLWGQRDYVVPCQRSKHLASLMGAQEGAPICGDQSASTGAGAARIEPAPMTAAARIPRLVAPLHVAALHGQHAQWSASRTLHTGALAPEQLPCTHSTGLTHPGGHIVPSDATVLDVVHRFLRCMAGGG